MSTVNEATPLLRAVSEDDEISLLDLALTLAEHWKLLILGPLAAGLAALGIAFALPPIFTARAVLLPPQQQQSMAAAALQSLGALAGIAGAAAGIKNPADQYVALLRSTTVADRIIEAFDLDSVYEKEFREDTRKTLADNVSISADKTDGLIRVEVDDRDPRRAAAIANRYVEELRRLMNELAMTEAQQRRRFFEEKLTETRDRLTAAQTALQATGFNEGALRAEPRAAAETYAALRAQVTAAEVRLQSMRATLAEQAPEFQRALAELSALRQQLARAEAQNAHAASGEYIARYREFKYQEALFELFARQYELARVDESREGLLVQAVDVAQPPERKSKPKRALVAVLTTLASGFVLMLWVLARHAWRRAGQDPQAAQKMARLRQLLRWRSQ